MAEPLMDNIARILASSVPRRRALKLISGGLVGVAFAHLAGRPASAQRFFSCDRGGDNNGWHRGRCDQGEIKCGGDCCAATEMCVQGRCCPDGSSERLCGHKCCPEGSRCAGDDCCPPGREVCDGQCCDAGEVCGRSLSGWWHWWGHGRWHCVSPQISPCER